MGYYEDMVVISFLFVLYQVAGALDMLQYGFAVHVGELCAV